jgi:uncharacterized protein YciI
MTLVYLITGPNSATNTREQKSEIFKGHMANIQKLADDGKLLIAGPFGKPRDPAWRGIFIFDVPTTKEAQALAGSDPGVIAGEFATIIREVEIPASVRDLPRFEKELQAELKAQGTPDRKPGEVPPAIRPYVILHTQDLPRARAALKSPTAPRTIWWARFTDTPRHQPRAAQGIIVLDAATVEEARKALDQLDTGTIDCDGWYSTTSLTRLTASAE